MSGRGEREYSPGQAGAVANAAGPCSPGPRRYVEDRDVLTVDPKRQPARARAIPVAVTRHAAGWSQIHPPTHRARWVSDRAVQSLARYPPGGDPPSLEAVPRPCLGVNGRGTGTQLNPLSPQLSPGGATVGLAPSADGFISWPPWSKRGAGQPWNR